MKNALRTMLFAVLATVGLISCEKQGNPVSQVPVQTAQSAVNVALRPLIEEMIADETVKKYLLNSVEFTNAHAAWIKRTSKSKVTAFFDKRAADRKAGLPTQSPIMSQAELEEAFKIQANNFAQVQKRFPILAQLSDEDNAEVFDQVERGIMAATGVSELASTGGCGAGYRACTKNCGTDFRCNNACYDGYLACEKSLQQ